jgi:hypothetical protein
VLKHALQASRLRSFGKTFSPELAYYELRGGTQNRPEFHLFMTKSAFHAPSIS